MSHPSSATAYFVALVAICVTSCSAAKSPEEQCLLSDRLKFKDPDSLKVVANLGDRGIPSDGKGSFWIRYSATNSYGARTSANMACQIGASGGWERSGYIEANAVATVYTKYLDKAAAVMEAKNREAKACKDSACVTAVLGPSRAPEKAANDEFAKATALAKQRVYESPEPLDAL